MDPRVQRIVARFEALAPADLPLIGELYTPEAQFKDPFNQAVGLVAIRAVFQHMFDALQAPRFIVRDVLVEGDQCFLTWDFRFTLARLGPLEQCIHGGSHLRLSEDGRISLHRDYWDAAEELYEKLPVVGTLMRWLKRRASG
jgi:hypothetical protein